MIASLLNIAATTNGPATFGVTHQQQANAARHIREDGWHLKARPTSSGAEWFLADKEGHEVKPTDDGASWTVDPGPDLPDNA